MRDALVKAWTSMFSALREAGRPAKLDPEALGKFLEEQFELTRLLSERCHEALTGLSKALEDERVFVGNIQVASDLLVRGSTQEDINDAVASLPEGVKLAGSPRAQKPMGLTVLRKEDILKMAGKALHEMRQSGGCQDCSCQEQGAMEEISDCATCTAENCPTRLHEYMGPGQSGGGFVN